MKNNEYILDDIEKIILVPSSKEDLSDKHFITQFNNNGCVERVFVQKSVKFKHRAKNIINPEMLGIEIDSNYASILFRSNYSKVLDLITYKYKPLRLKLMNDSSNVEIKESFDSMVTAITLWDTYIRLFIKFKNKDRLVEVLEQTIHHIRI